VEFICGDSRNPSRGEGMDVELGIRTSKYILVFAFSIFQFNCTCLYLAFILLLIYICLILCLHLYWSN